MQAFTTNVTRLALYLAYKAGLLTWQQLPLTTQVQCIRAGTIASLHAYTATLAPATVQWCNAAAAATGGHNLTNTALPTVAPHAASNACPLHATVRARKVG